jgi:glycosyltransferase involved in cell wall biosynthesis
MKRPLGSVVIAAYDEEAVIGRCLKNLLSCFAPDELQVVVVANGCSDRTAEVARTFPVRVLELPEASKSAALRAGDRVASSFPRIYLDADVLLSGEAARCVLEHLDQPGALAARPPFRYATDGCSSVVRRYYRTREQLPSMTTSLWGAGVYALSEEGRARFGSFPEVIGDDLFVAQQFAHDEAVVIECAPVIVLTPRTLTDLVHVLRRQNKGKRKLAHEAYAQPTTRVLGDLAALIRRSPGWAGNAFVFAVLACLSRSRPLSGAARWERDASSRVASRAA